MATRLLMMHGRASGARSVPEKLFPVVCKKESKKLMNVGVIQVMNYLRWSYSFKPNYLQLFYRMVS